MEEIKAYQCDYCNKYSISKKYIQAHEKECYHNPITKACATCENNVAGTRKVMSSIVNYPVTEVYPICSKGIEISILNRSESGFKRNLQHHCESWEEKEEREYDFE